MVFVGALAPGLVHLPGRVEYIAYLVSIKAALLSQKAPSLRKISSVNLDIFIQFIRIPSEFVEWLTVAILALRLLTPRPPFHQLLRQRGALACGVALLTLALSVLVGAPALARPVVSGVAVAGSWLVLGLNRWWITESSWIDRVGSGLGMWWIGLALLHGLELYLRV
jgi:hypothetical protein